MILAKALRLPHTYPRPKVWRSGRPWEHRTLYQMRDGEWGVSHEGDLPTRLGGFPPIEVKQLLDRDLIEPTSPDEEFSYSPTAKLFAMSPDDLARLP